MRSIIVRCPFVLGVDGRQLSLWQLFDLKATIAGHTPTDSQIGGRESPTGGIELAIWKTDIEKLLSSNPLDCRTLLLKDIDIPASVRGLTELQRQSTPR